MPMTIGGHPILAPHGLINRSRGILSDAAQNVSSQYSRNTDAQNPAPSAPSAGIDYAQRLARERGDVSTAASTVGVNARSSKAAKIKKAKGK